MIFSTSNREVEISKANDDSYFRKSDVVGFVESYISEIITESGVDKNAHTNDVLRKVAHGLEELPTIPQTVCDNDCEHCSWVECPLPQKPIKHFGAIECPKCGQLIYDDETEYEWCKGCKEYDTEKHCCHRWSSFIRYTLNDKVDSVLEDIKAEIEEFKNNEHTYEYGGFDRAYNGIMEIIERHISGKE